MRPCRRPRPRRRPPSSPDRPRRLPAELAKAVEEAARAEGTTFSAWLAQTAAHRLKLEVGRKALTEWERENGPLTEAELAEGRARARASLGREPADAAERKSA